MPAKPDDRELRIGVAQAEARRAGGVAQLVQLAQSPDAHARALAVRGLGRIGDADALDAIDRALGDGDPEVVATALDALGVAASLDEPNEDEQRQLAAKIWLAIYRGAAQRETRGSAVIAALPSVDHRILLAGIQALGRAGDASFESYLARWLGTTAEADVKEQCALALARFGRRKIAFQDEARRALVVATRDADPRVRYAAVYALGREQEPPADESAASALRDRLDDDAETRAQAIAGLVKRKAAKLDELIGYLRDRDWRVAVEAVRAVAADPVGQRALAVLIAVAPDQVAEEALRQLAASSVDEYERTLLAKLVPNLDGWRGCFTRAILREPRVGCIGVDLAILADVAKASPDDSWRRGAVRALLESGDQRVKLAAFPYLDAPQLVAALAAPGLDERGAALDAIGERFAGDAAVEAAIVQRARVETDLELSADLFAQIGQRKLAAGAEACRAGLGAPAAGGESRPVHSGHPVRARAAAECLRQLGEAVPPPVIADATPPPVDVAAVIGKHITWHLQTTRGSIDIELSPDDAPWNVATVVALTQKHFYDGLAFHRVVRDFVVQGGDPLQSGWGGPGFTTPAEPSAGAKFVEGGVGMADAGRDSGGSQFFIMHSRAAHLDGRYTWIGHVVSGQAIADELRIGDRVFSATVDVR